MTRRFAVNTLYNLAGSFLPMVLALITVPLYLHRIGDARYGVLAIVWLLAGYFSVLDMGLSRATTNQIAQLHDATAEKRQGVFWTALTLNGSFGMLGALLLWGAGGFLVTRFFKMPDNLRSEVLASLPWIAAAVPLSTVGGVLNGTLEARGRFLTVNLMHLLGSTLFQLFPLLVAYQHGPDLSWLIPAAILSRFATFFPLLVLTLKSLPVSSLVGPDRNCVRGLLGYGGWVTVSNLVSPLLTALDQLLVGSILGVRAVAWYNVPYNLASRLVIFPVAVIRVLFPEFSKIKGPELLVMANEGVRLIAATFTPIILLGILALRPFLDIWIGKELGLIAFPVGLTFLLGTWINAIAFVPFALLQARGRPDVVAKIHVVEVLPFIAVLWFLAGAFGVKGAAWAWTLRVLADTVVFLWIGRISRTYIAELLPPAVLLMAAWVVASTLTFNSAGYLLSGALLVGCTVSWSLWRDRRILDLVRSSLDRVRF